ncbi:hypothetical protein PV325_004591 [Microctonus aethiopoides]|uniref:Tubulin delta chain n=1 Tax=Microctonus aethiopoides TaxID=144406 RepID=A0AA39FXQ3_9HYME|nr:hypothetical protein PV325_004591 [Microctonus aethiopoides]KAK0177598.1 hypothetical protein PV328_001635 [Microctonus aethiopoides]
MLTLQFGQCGNQLGHELFSKVTEDIKCSSPGISLSDSYEYIESSNAKWFEGLSKNKKRFARAILIDTERKVIDKVMNKNNKEWCFRHENIITSKSTGGSANNWSFGYLKKGPDLMDSILEATRRELERADRLDTFLCLLSCGGGTGSGLGSYAIQTLRDTFPTKNIIGTLIFPFEFGEVATQNYNIILSLARIVEDSDLIIVMENERLHKELLTINQSRTSKSINGVDFPNDINDIACQKLISIFQPAKNIVNEYSYNYSNYIISKIVPHPAYKLATIEAVPLVLERSETSSQYSLQSGKLNSEKWLSHFKSLKRNLSSKHTNNYLSKLHKDNANPSEKINNSRSLSNILITRGSSLLKNKNNYHSSNDDNPKIHYEQLNHNDLYSPINWLQSSERLTYFHQNRRLLNNEKFTSIITNNSRINNSLDDIISKAWNSYTYGAYLHQYKSHGLQDDDFLRTFAKVEHLISNYKKL